MADTEAEEIKIHRGLNKVYLDRTRVTFIDGRQGKLLYRGYSIHDLAAYSSFEESTYLILHGELPTREALEVFDTQLKAARQLPEPIIEIIGNIKDAHPMTVLRTAVSALALYNPDTSDNSAQALLQKGIHCSHHTATVAEDQREPERAALGTACDRDHPPRRHPGVG